MENQMYLAPSQVEELRKLGVEFEDTFLVNQLHLVNKDEGDYIWKCKLNNPTLDKKLRIMPAPSLQEVLEKLPKVIEVFCDEDCSDLYYLTLSHICSDYWSVYYLKNSYKIQHLANYSNANPLLAAYELLLWVAKTYPDCLIDKTEL